MAEARKYSDEEVQAILDRALKGDAGGEAGISHADLLAIGEQVGLSPEVLTRAADEARAAKLDRAAATAVSSRRRRLLAAHAAVFALLNGFLFAVNAATTPGEWWVLFPVFFWGLALALHAGLSLGVSPSRRALDRERRRLAPAQTERSRVRVDPGATGEAEALESDESARAGEEQAAAAPRPRS